MNTCPLCHDGLGADSDTALVPVSPVVYPGIAGLAYMQEHVIGLEVQVRSIPQFFVQ